MLREVVQESRLWIERLFGTSFVEGRKLFYKRERRSRHDAKSPRLVNGEVLFPSNGHSRWQFTRFYGVDTSDGQKVSPLEGPSDPCPIFRAGNEVMYCHN